MRKLGIYIIFFFGIFLLSTCRKYPENNLWFANPKNYYPIGKYITELKVNGVDSMEALNYHYLQDYYSSNPLLPDNVRDLVFSCLRDGNSGYFFIDNENRFTSSIYSWGSKYKKLYIGLGLNSLNSFARLLFVNKNTEWEVLYIDKKGKKKYKSTYNGNIYEITFENRNN